MYDYDIAILGGGPAGFAAAVRAWDHGKRVGLIERDRLGGAGVHDGALSSKTYWELSRDYLNAARVDRGYRAERIDVDLGRVAGCVAEAVGDKVRQLQTQLDALAEPDDRHGGSVTLVRGSAAFVDPHCLSVDRGDGSPPETISAERFVIATGSRPRTLPGIPVDGRRVMTSDHIGHLEDFPESIVIIGAGVIGCEFATVFANYGRTQVHLIDRAERILPFEDEDVASMCARNFEARGVTVHGQSRLVDLVVDEQGVNFTVENDGRRRTIAVDCALISIGRTPVTEGIGLEHAGVELTAQGHIVVDDTRTSAPHIHAVGDTTLDIALVNVAELEGRHAVDLMYGNVDERLDYSNLSTIMFLEPEVAAIGMNELEAARLRIPYRLAAYSYRLVNRAIAMRATEGYIKLLVSDDEHMRILGVRALGVHASTTIEAVSLMIHQRRPARELADLAHPHPAVTEGLQDCVRMLLGTSIYKPHVFASDLRLSHVTFDA